MVIVLASVHHNLGDPRILSFLIMVSNGPTYRRCLDELGPGADYGDNFHS